MANAIRMRAADAVSAKEGEVYVTLNGQRYNWMHITEIEATIEVKKGELNTLGSKMTGHKATNLTGKFKGKAFYVESEMRQAWLDFKNGGGAPVFEMHITNEDPTSPTGRQTAILKDCLSDSFTLAKLDAGGETLDEDIEGTFDDWELPETFVMLDGMEA